METVGRVNRYGETVYTVSEAVSMLQCGANLTGIILDDIYEINQFEDASELLLGESLTLPRETTSGEVSEYHRDRSRVWFFPKEYQTLDVSGYLRGKCNTDDELLRVDYELGMYEDRDLLHMLRLMVWLVDHMREHGIVWGVGRGSSVASFCLYLIGINKVNPLLYNLDIHEFLK